MASGKIKGITIELDGDTTKLNKALSSSENAARDSVKALREIEKSLKFNPGNTKLVEQQQRNLAEAINATKEKLKILQDADGQMKQQLNQGKISVDQYEAFQREIIATEGQLSSYEKRLSSSQSEQKRLEQATKNLSTIFEASGTKIDDFADILGEETVEAFKKGEGSSKQMEDALQKLGDALLGTGGDSEKLKENLDRLDDGVSFEKLQKEAVDSGAKIEKMGGSAEEAGASIKDINNEAVKISGLDAAINLFGKLNDAALDAIGSIMDAWGKLDEGQDTIIAKTGATGEAADKMGKVFQNVYTSMPADSKAVGDAIGELNTQFGLQDEALDSATRKLLQYSEINGSDVTQATQSAKAAMDQFGLSGGDLSNVLDVVTKAGQDTGVQTEKLLDSVARGAPALQGLGLSFEESVVTMSQFEQAGVDGSKALSYLTKAQSKAASQGKTLTEALSDFSQIANSSASETDKINAASELFGSKGGAMMLKAAEEGRLNFEGLKNAVGDAGGTVENTYNAMLDPIDQVTVAQHNLDTILGDIGGTIQEAAAPAIEMLVDFLKSVNEVLQGMDPNLKQAIVVIGAIVFAILGVVAAIATIQTALGLLGPIITNVTGIFGALSSGIGGLFSFVAANPIVLIVAAIAAAVVLLIANWDKVKSAAKALWDKIVEIWNGIKNTTSSVWNGIKSTMSGIWEGIKNGVTNAINQVKSTVSNIWNGIKDKTSSVWNGIKSTISGVVNGIASTVRNVFNRIRDTITGIWDGIVNFFRNIHIPLPHFSISGSLNPFSGDFPPHVGINWYKEGGIFDRPSVIGVGESGSEAVVPTHKLDAFFDAALKRVGAGEKTQDAVNVYIAQATVREEADITRIAEELQRLIERERRTRHV